MADGGKLGAGQVADTVQLDEILRGFDPETRARFSTWFDQAGVAAKGNAEHLNDALALLTPFAEDTDEVLKVLRQQSDATQRFVRDTGYVFDALSERKGQLRDLIRNSNRTWEAIASRDAQLADTFRVFPTFLREGRDDHPAPDQVRRRHGSADHAAAAGGARAVAHADRPGRAGAGPEGPVPGPRPARARVEGAACRPPSRCSTTRVRSCAGSTRGCATSRRSSTTSASTGARSRPSSSNDAAATQGTERGFNDGSKFLHYLRTANPREPGHDDRLAVPPRARTARTRTPSRAATTSSGPRATSRCSAPSSAPQRPTPPTPEPNEFLSRRTWPLRSTSSSSAATENRGKAPPCDPQAPLGRLVGPVGAVPAPGATAVGQQRSPKLTA